MIPLISESRRDDPSTIFFLRDDPSMRRDDPSMIRDDPFVFRDDPFVLRNDQG